MASMVGAQRRYRKPLLGGVLALGASAVTWVVAQTVLGSLARYGERLEAIVSLAAIAVLLLILNWFYHRVYWQEHLAELHGKKRTLLQGAGLSLAVAQVAGLVLLGFTSVYREGFETVLFLQALTLEAGAWTVLQGVAVGFAAVVGVFFLVVALERKLPHKKMLIATGLMITWVLVVLVGQTVQTMQKVGWIPVTPIEGLELPYWSGVWLGLYPTWEGLLAQAAALAFVLGSYFAAEAVRNRRRARILAAPIGPRRVDRRHARPGTSLPQAEAAGRAPACDEALPRAEDDRLRRAQATRWRPGTGGTCRPVARAASPRRRPARSSASGRARRSRGAASRASRPACRRRVAAGDAGAAVDHDHPRLGDELVDGGAHLFRLVPHDAVARDDRAGRPRSGRAGRRRWGRRRQCACRSRSRCRP